MNEEIAHELEHVMRELNMLQLDNHLQQKLIIWSSKTIYSCINKLRGENDVSKSRSETP